MNLKRKNEAGAPPGLVDLAAERLGGAVVLANDDFFAPKENLIKPGRGVFIPEKYTDRGKWMDGWETRRRRTPGHDWCIVKLGLPGIIRRVDIDTNHFLGNHPPFASLDSACLEDTAAVDTAHAETIAWKTILPKSSLAPGSQNLFAVNSRSRSTHVRLNIFPDGGVARLRLYGTVTPDWSRVSSDKMIDLAAIENGGTAILCSDMFFSSMNNLLMPGPSLNMGDGWETKRKRVPGHDWIIIGLGAPGVIERVEVDTTHFKGNYPDMCSIDAGDLRTRRGKGSAAGDTRTSRTPVAPTKNPSDPRIKWGSLLSKTRLGANARHVFDKELAPLGPVTHVRLNIFPDGGIARLRVWGRIHPA